MKNSEVSISTERPLVTAMILVRATSQPLPGENRNKRISNIITLKLTSMWKFYLIFFSLAWLSCFVLWWFAFKSSIRQFFSLFWCLILFNLFSFIHSSTSITQQCDSCQYPLQNHKWCTIPSLSSSPQVPLHSAHGLTISPIAPQVLPTHPLSPSIPHWLVSILSHFNLTHCTSSLSLLEDQVEQSHLLANTTSPLKAH